MPANLSFTYLAVALAVCGTAVAQDTRHVVEPHFPRHARFWRAHLSAPDGQLSLADEHNPDTVRLQSAIDGCPAGQSRRTARG